MSVAAHNAFREAARAEKSGEGFDTADLKSEGAARRIGRTIRLEEYALLKMRCG
jgi:hypothetical protein